MKETIKFLVVMWAVAVMIWAPCAEATLSAVVTPGYQFGPTETPTIDNLNLLGEPSIQIVGTVDGTTGLTPGSVNGALLANSVVDGVTLNFNGSSPRAIYVTTAGLIGVNSGLVAPPNNTLQVYVDTNFFQLTTNNTVNTNAPAPGSTNWLSLATTNTGNGLVDATIANNAGINLWKIACASNYLTYGNSNGVLAQLMFDPRTLSIQTLTNVYTWTNNIGGTNYVITVTNIGPGLAEISYAASVYAVGSGSITNQTGPGHITVTNGTLVSVANPYTAPPSAVRWVFVCLTNNNGYIAGDELDAHSIYAASGGYPAYTYGASATNVWITASAANPYDFPNKTNGAQVTFNPVQWSSKAYLKP